MKIDSRHNLEQAAVLYGTLPFFSNHLRGFSVEEMCVPGLLFGGNFDEGCWEWKGPVIRQRTTAYGKFFDRKAGFVSLELLPDFLNYRRAAYPVKPDSTEEMLLEIIRENDGMTSTDLKAAIFGSPFLKRNWNDLPEHETTILTKGKRKSLEGPLQRLQMGGWLIISDFVYKRTKRGDRYGWGVAQYSTPELIFNQKFNISDITPQQSLDNLISNVQKNFAFYSKESIKELLK